MEIEADEEVGVAPLEIEADDGDVALPVRRHGRRRRPLLTTGLPIMFIFAAVDGSERWARAFMRQASRSPVNMGGAAVVFVGLALVRW